MNLLFTGDWQATASNLDRCQLVLNQILLLLKKENIDYVIFLGDAKEVFNPLDIRVLNFWIDAILRIKVLCPILFLLGNHDLIAPRDGVPSFLPSLEAAGAQVFDTPEYHRLKDGRTVLWMVPYIRDPQKQREVFQPFPGHGSHTVCNDSNLLIFHNEVTGCQRTVYSNAPTGLTLSEMKADQYDLCIGGHIHNPHNLKNVIYVGSPFCCDWAEVNQAKRLLLLRNHQGSTWKTISILSCVPGWYDPDLPDFHPPKDLTGCQIRVSVPITTDPNKEMAEARRVLEKKYPGAVLHLQPDFQKGVTPNSVNTSGTDEEIIKRYLEKISLPPRVTIPQVSRYLEKYLPAGSAWGVRPLKFLWASGSNTLCFNRVRLDIDHPGLILVTGVNTDFGAGLTERSNGSGKSSILSLLFIALFGKTPKGQVHDEWAQRQNDHTAVVELEVTLTEGSSLLIIRRRRPGSLQVFVDGVERTMGSSTSTQALIESLTNLTWDVLTNSIYIGQTEIGSVFGTDKERKELFSRLLGLDRFLIAQEKLRKTIGKHRRVLEELEGEITTSTATLEESSVSLQAITDALKESPVVDPSIQKQLVQEQLDLRSKITGWEKENRELRIWLDENQKRFEHLLGKAVTAGSRADQLKEQVTKTEGVKGSCPLCGSMVSRGHLEKHLEELDAQYTIYRKEEDRYEAHQVTNRQFRRVKMTLFQDNTLEIERAQKKIRQIDDELTSINHRLDAHQRLESFRDRNQQRVDKINSDLKVHNRARDGLLLHKAFLEVCEQTVGRNGLPAFLCTVAVPQLNIAAEKYCQLFSEGEIGVQFLVDGGDIDVEIRNLHGGKTITDQSHGESRIAGLITAFAFRSVLVPHNILILDEPGEGLDPEAARMFARGLGTLTNQFGSVFLVTHNPHILAELEPDIHLEVTKKNGVSTVHPV